MSVDGSPTSYEVLRHILDDVNHWLQFAEAKNAAVVTLNLAIIIGLLTIAGTAQDLPEYLTALATFLCAGFAISGLISLASFFPLLNRVALRPKATGAEFTGNLFYFGDMAQTTATRFLARLNRRLGGGQASSAIDYDLADQIVINSKIAVQKYWLATLALRGTGSLIIFSLLIAIWEILT